MPYTRHVNCQSLSRDIGRVSCELEIDLPKYRRRCRGGGDKLNDVRKEHSGLERPIPFFQNLHGVILITGPLTASGDYPRSPGGILERSSLVTATGKLAIAGDQSGFGVEQMIRLLDEGLTVETLLDIISWRLGQSSSDPGNNGASSMWIH